MRRFFLAGTFLVWSALSICAAEFAPKESTILTDLDIAFIGAHSAANELDLAAGGPIILLRDGQLILVRNKTEVAAPIILPDYEAFKTFAHVPVAIYLLLGSEGASTLDDQLILQLRAYHAKLEDVENNIEQIDLNGDNLERQKRILAESKRFLDKVVQQHGFSTEELHLFTRRMLPMIKANIACAAASQLDAMHSQVMGWKQEMTPAEWNRVRVAVKGAVLARNGSLAKQYFERLLRIKGEGMRLTYMELYFPPTPLQTLLATRSVDRGIGNAVFGDPDRMFRDVLADAATAHIKCMKFE
ncbi:hypothetical protein [Bythopirellula polymerisocia]|uniref:TraB/GumN family protein n=1 Tax=Bythopirellula polymerisocia TaxID=2528003 RepID=A0A5C6CTV9_9BACT|nr:hypothetical protein [Bythopirellula polymerisocia]TWU27305.1 hypothetical protein Pla144_20770 [Bythopirellula polymerisocia]